MKKVKFLSLIVRWYAKRSTKQLQYLIAGFIFILSFFGPLYKLKVEGPGGRGYYLPTEPLSWAEIFRKMPEYALFALGFALFFYFWSGFLFKAAIRFSEKEKKRKAEKSYSQPQTHECRICGFFSEKYPWGEDGKSPNFEICPCCGAQFGVDDDTDAIIKAYRTKWLSKGAKWFAKNLEPKCWNLDGQLENIPEKFK